MIERQPLFRLIAISIYFSRLDFIDRLISVQREREREGDGMKNIIRSNPAIMMAKFYEKDS